MLVHGFGETNDVWKNQVAFLQNKFKLIVPDLPGSGESAMIDDMSMEGMAEVLKSIIDKENSSVIASNVIAIRREAEKQTLIAHSMGGYIALAFAEKYNSYLF